MSKNRDGILYQPLKISDSMDGGGNMDKPVFNMVSFSGGKDSTAMLLRMIEEGFRIDGVLFCDTGLEFPQMYEHIDRVERETGISIMRVKPESSFEYMMFEQPIKRRADSPVTLRYGADMAGYGWAGPKMRWCTNMLKNTPRERLLKTFRPHYKMRHYVGIAADEQKRLERKNNRNPSHIHPLVDWGMTEADCLEYCYRRGYDWGGLYRIFDRVSCWCCPLQSLGNLRKLRVNFPELWEQMKKWDDRSFRKFKPGYTVRELETRFRFEEECISMGKAASGKAFMEELRDRLGRDADGQRNYP